MKKKRMVVALLGSTALSLATLLASPANPAFADGAEGCQITDSAPETVVIGITGKRVAFDVKTDCDDTKDMKWAAVGDLYPGSAHVSWFGACTYDYSGPALLDCDHDGSAVIDPILSGDRIGNDNAGERTLHLYAFEDKNHNGADDDYACDLDTWEDCVEYPNSVFDDSTITLLRRTSWSNSLNASPEPRRTGQKLEITAEFARADWNTGTYASPSIWAKLQFRATNETTYHTLRTVRVREGKLDTSVKALTSGYWRLVYPGTKTVAASTSNADYVKVSPTAQVR